MGPPPSAPQSTTTDHAADVEETAAGDQRAPSATTSDRGIQRISVARSVDRRSRKPWWSSGRAQRLLRRLPRRARRRPDIRQHEITAFIGPSGCGKSTMLRCFNRMNDLIDIGAGRGRSSTTASTSTTRRSTRSRCAAGSAWSSRSPTRSPSRSTTTSPTAPRSPAPRAMELDDIVESALRRAGALGRGQGPSEGSAGMGLSGGQQQRLCIARAIADRPRGLLMDEPCSALDPIATARIEDLMQEIKAKYTIVIVTHNMQQAAPASATGRRSSPPR
jgi:ABC-type phosphate transport system ATPase subunit